MNLIQSIRLIHAIAETGHRVSVPPKVWWRLRTLRRRFGVGLTVAPPGLAARLDASVSHREPTTRIGELTRPLVFPHAIVETLFSMWPTERRPGVLFVGLMTDARRRFVSEWAGRHEVQVDELVGPSEGGLVARVDQAWEQDANPNRLIACESRRGRDFPVKAWDEDYYRLMASARYVLCPSGDFVWTYRFFEAALCGAVPIVEETCSLYDGYTHYRSSDAPSDYAWDADVATANREKAVADLTIERSELASAIEEMIGAASRA